MRKPTLFMISLASLALVAIVILSGCSAPAASGSGSKMDTAAQIDVANRLASTQPTPTDIDYSLERYNLIRRAYWVNGQREKANALPCSVEKPLGYVVLFTQNSVVGRFVVDGKVSSLNSYLTPNAIDAVYGSYGSGYTTLSSEMADVDGSYGENDQGIFFFTPDGKYIEWTGAYLYSDIPFTVESPIISYSEVSPLA